MLDIEDVHVSFGKAHVLKGLDLTGRPGRITGIVGPNGAGKSTLLKAVAGLNPVHRGRVVLDGQPLVLEDPAAMVRSGVRLVPQGRALFTSMTVQENLRMGSYMDRDRSSWKARVDELAPLFPEVVSRLGDKAGALSGGQQQLVAIMRGLMSPARVLMLDEPSLGVAPLVVDRIGSVLREVAAQGELIVLLVEQNLNLAVKASDEIAILARGRTQRVVPPDAVVGDEGQALLKEVFFGPAAEEEADPAPDRRPTQEI